MALRILILLLLVVPALAGPPGVQNPAWVSARTASADGPSFPSSGLTHYYAMEEADITTREDSVGSLDLADDSDAWSQDAGKHNNCATMDTGEVGPLSSAATTLGTEWTIKGWFRAEVTGMSVVGLMQFAGASAVSIDITDIGQISFFVETDVVVAEGAFTSQAFNLVVVTLSAGEINASINGGNFTSPIPVTYSNPTGQLTVGDPNNQIISADEVGIWNRALTQQEVTDLWAGGNGIFYTTP